MKDLLPVCTLLLGQVSPPGSLPRPEDLVDGPGLSSVPVTWLLALLVVQFLLHHQAPLSMGFPQARILMWVAFPFSRGSSQPRDWTRVSQTAARFFIIWATQDRSDWKIQDHVLCKVKVNDKSILIHALTYILWCSHFLGQQTEIQTLWR